MTTVKDKYRNRKVYVMHELLVCQLTNDTFFFKVQSKKIYNKKSIRSKMQKWPIRPYTQNSFQSECKVGLGLKDPKNYKLQFL